MQTRTMLAPMGAEVDNVIARLWLKFISFDELLIQPCEVSCLESGRRELQITSVNLNACIASSSQLLDGSNAAYVTECT